MKKVNFKKLFSVLVSLMLIAVMAFTLASCTENTGKETPETTSPVTESIGGEAPEEPQNQADAIVLGEGETQFIFNITHKDGSVKNYTINTDKETVGAALLELKLIDGEDSQYGLYVKTVDGEALDYDTDQMYWAFYENGNYAQSGVDATKINAGATYEFKAEK